MPLISPSTMTEMDPIKQIKFSLQKFTYHVCIFSNFLTLKNYEFAHPQVLIFLILIDI